MANMRKITLSIFKSSRSILLCMALLSCTAALAEPTFKTHYRYFDIGGTNIEALWHDINRKGPKSNKGVGHAGYTSFDLENSVGIIPKGGQCQITSIKFHLTSTVQLPKWTDEHNSDREMQFYWQAFSSDVKRHEDQHVEIARQSILDLEQKLLKLRPQKSCKPLKRKIRNTINASARARDREQNAFERKEIRGQKDRLTKMIEELRNN